MGKGRMTLGGQLGLITAALLLSGCAKMPPYEALFDPSPEAIGTGITGVGLVRAVVIIAKYQATERQRQVAEQNARRAYQRIVARQEAIERPSRVKTVTVRKAPEPTLKNTPSPNEPVALVPHEPKPDVTPSPARITPPLPPTPKFPNSPRYIAVDTAPDARSKGKKSVMLWDTVSQELIGNEVYDLESTPPMMKTVRFEAYEAQYVGLGNW